MKKYIIFLLTIITLTISGCSIDYKAYFAFYGDDILGGQVSGGQSPTNPGTTPSNPGTTPSNPGTTPSNPGTTPSNPGTTPTNPGTTPSNPGTTPSNPGTQPGGSQGTLMSEIIPDGILAYPNSNSQLIAQYGEVFPYLASYYKVHSSYYSSEYDTLYLAYGKIGQNDQTLDSRDLALIEEHVLNYFKSDVNNSEYRDYIKVIRIYSDYESSACRVATDPGYASIMGCADYNQLDAAINLNGIKNMNEFFNDTNHYQPKRDTFAHEYGHVSTYYHMVLKNRGNYEEYLKIRLGEHYNSIYPQGLLQNYDSDATYHIQPAEILADDFVDMYYDVSQKVETDLNDYEIAYQDKRNSLKGTSAVVDLNTDPQLYAKIKAYYDNYLNNQETVLVTPKVVSASGNVYGTIKSINDNQALLTLVGKKAIVIANVIINGKSYYKIILSNLIKQSEYGGDLRDYTDNVGYILESDCTNTSDKVLKFTKFDGSVAQSNIIIPLTATNIPTLPYPVNIIPYYEFSYFIESNNQIELYNLFDPTFGIQKFSSRQFK